jgi:uncharacterized membrane protein YraQ (UPF0718 family)
MGPVKWLRKWWLFLLVAAVDASSWAWNPSVGVAAAKSSADFLLEIAGILPPILVLMGLFDAWVPRQMVEAHVGPESGWKGRFLAILLGSFAAGPLFAAFPVALSLRRKGARLANIAIFLGSWAAIKVPMILLESSYLGLRFSLVRTGLTIVGILFAGWVVERLVPESSIPA